MLGLNTLVQNRYLVKNLIGRGGMGAVYLAEDTRFSNRKVALKEMLFTNNPKLEAAFGREANLLAQLNHRGLPKVSDYFNDRGFQYLVMEYVPGDDLETLLKKIQAPFPYKRVLNWADSLLDILEYLHTQNPTILHRDIKPQNLKLTDDNKIILLDFGLAKDLASATQMPTGNSLAGFTPNYAPLEQLEGSQATTQTDLYLFSATIYHLLTNSLPASSLNRVQAKMDNRNDPLYPAHQLNPEVPVKFSALLGYGLSLQREQRPMSATEMRQRLREIVNESATVAEISTEQMNLHNSANQQKNIQTAIFPMHPEHIQPVNVPPVNVQPVQESVQTIAFPSVQESPQTVAFIPSPSPAPTQVSVEPKNFVPSSPQNSQPMFATMNPKKSRRGIFLPLLIVLILMLGVGGVGAYFIAQRFLVKSDTLPNTANTKTVSNTEKKTDAVSGVADAGSKDANSNSNANSTETVKEETEKPIEKKTETKVVPQQKQVQKTTVQKQTKSTKSTKQTPKQGGGGGGIFQ